MKSIPETNYDFKLPILLVVNYAKGLKFNNHSVAYKLYNLLLHIFYKTYVILNPHNKTVIY